jgi:hypothetical protein
VAGEYREIEITIKLARSGNETATVEMRKMFLSSAPPKDFREWARLAIEQAEGCIEQSQHQHGEQSP